MSVHGAEPRRSAPRNTATKKEHQKRLAQVLAEPGADGEGFAVATGFAISADRVLTCEHVLRGANRVQVRFLEVARERWLDAKVIWPLPRPGAEGTGGSSAHQGRGATRKAQPGEGVYQARRATPLRRAGNPSTAGNRPSSSRTLPTETGKDALTTRNGASDSSYSATGAASIGFAAHLKGLRRPRRPYEWPPKGSDPRPKHHNSPRKVPHRVATSAPRRSRYSVVTPRWLRIATACRSSEAVEASSASSRLSTASTTTTARASSREGARASVRCEPYVKPASNMGRIRTQVGIVRGEI